MKHFVTIEQLKAIDELKAPPIQYVPSLPTHPENSLYGVLEKKSTNYRTVSSFPEILELLFIRSEDHWDILPDYSISIENSPFTQVYNVEDSYAIRTVDDPDNNQKVFDATTSYEFDIIKTRELFEFYAGNAKTGDYVKLDNIADTVTQQEDRPVSGKGVYEYVTSSVADAEQRANTNLVKSQSEVKQYIDNGLSENSTELKQYTDSSMSESLSDAKQYTDNELSKNSTELRQYTDDELAKGLRDNLADKLDKPNGIAVLDSNGLIPEKAISIDQVKYSEEKSVHAKFDEIDRNIAEAGKVDTVNGVKPDANKNVEIDLSDFVTKSTDQEITSNKVFNGNIAINANNTDKSGLADINVNKFTVTADSFELNNKNIVTSVNGYIANEKNEIEIESLTGLLAKVSDEASKDNKLIDKNYVDSVASHNSAKYISNNGLPFEDFESLKSYSGTVTQNDFTFIKGSDENGNIYYDYYAVDTTDQKITWSNKFRLSSQLFTSAQWLAISSGITADKVAEIDKKADIVSIPTKTSSLENDGNGLSAFAVQADLDTKANSDNVVTLDGNQTISGNKEFENTVHFHNNLTVSHIYPNIGPDAEEDSVMINGYTKGGTDAMVEVSYNVEMSGDAIKANGKNLVTSVNDETADDDGKLYLNNLGKVNESITKQWTPSTFRANSGWQVGGGSSTTKGMSPSGIYVDAKSDSSGKWAQRSDTSWAVQINTGTSFYVPVVTEGTITVTYYNQGTKTYNVNTGNMVVVSGQNGKFYKIDCMTNDYIGTITYSHTTDFALKTVGKDVEVLGDLTVSRVKLDRLYVNDGIFMHQNSNELGGYIHMGKPRYYDPDVDSHGLLNERNNDGITIECDDDETAGIHINGDGILMYVPPDSYALNIISEDTGESIFMVDDSGVYFKGNKIS